MPDRDFPPEVDQVFKELWQEIAVLHWLWKTYCSVFKKENGDVLAPVQSAMMAFDYSLRTSIFMNLGRLTDSLEFRKGKDVFSNLTLRLLVNRLRGHCPEPFIKELNDQVEAIHRHLEPVKELRNKTLGHSDLKTLLDPGSTLPTISRGHIDEALTQIERFMNAVVSHFRDAEINFRANFSLGDGEYLVEFLRIAKETIEADTRRRIERLKG